MAVAAAIGIFAAVGIALKPFYAIVWVALAAVNWRGSPHRRPENIAVVATGTVYLVMVAVITPAFLDVLAEYGRAYRSFGARSVWAIITAPSVLAPVVAAPFIWILGRPDSLARIFLLAAAAALVGTVLQGKGWDYHYLPLLGLTVLAAILVLRSHWATLPVGLVLAYILTVPSLRVIASAGTGENWRSRPIAQLRAGLGSPESLAVLSSEMEDTFPYVNEERIRLVATYPVLWAFHPPRAPAYDTEALRRVREVMGSRVVADIERERPVVILSESRESFAARLGRPFDVMAHMRSRPGGSALNDYRLADTVGRFLVWRRR